MHLVCSVLQHSSDDIDYHFYVAWLKCDMECCAVTCRMQHQAGAGLGQGAAHHVQQCGEAHQL